MYESESNQAVEMREQIPVDILDCFRNIPKTISARTELPWGEHCTECAAPQCYTTCDLYSARYDDGCRRFIDGIVRVDHIEGFNPYILKVRFKQWAKLYTEANCILFSLAAASRIDRRDQLFARLLNTFPLPRAIRARLIRLRLRWKVKMLDKKWGDNKIPSYFFMECYNPQASNLDLTITARSLVSPSMPPFQTLIHLKEGYNQTRIPVAEIADFIDVRTRFAMDIIPNEFPEGSSLYFGALDFVRDKAVDSETDDTPSEQKDGKPKRCKCVVWDLDNTLWDGILVEDGLSDLRLKPGVREIIEELDRRGILHSIASKNDMNYAMEALKRFGLDQFFLYPQISWNPKSTAVKQISLSLNIGMDTLLFIDDSEFERAEVFESFPEIIILDAAQYRDLPNLDICKTEITSESSQRRQMYKEQAVRERVMKVSGEDYSRFLKSCEIQLEITSMEEQDLQRTHELAQRTNQMNFSGNRYTKENLVKILNTPTLHTFVLKCQDRFGSYGTVGFSVVDSATNTMTDLMFSCRIQSKRIEHAFLHYILNQYAKGSDFLVRYRRTDRNAQSGAVFNDFGFEHLSEKDGVIILKFPKNKLIPQEEIIKITPLGAYALKQTL